MKPEKHFCEFSMRRAVFDADYEGGNEKGFLHPRLAYIEAGECVCVSEEGTLRMKAGEIWSLPAKKPYRSYWKATPEIRFYYAEYEADFLSLQIHRFSKLENTQLKEAFRAVYEAENEWGATAAFYTIMERVAPLIAEKRDEKLERILPAIRYLREHFAEKCKVGELASLCLMSESKFYELFREAVGSPPTEFKNRLKVSRAVDLLGKRHSLEEICEILNYSSPGFLRRQIEKYTGKKPKEIKREALRETL